jgi:Tetracyclin repressor-like, C-terminal domain
VWKPTVARAGNLVDCSLQFDHPKLRASFAASHLIGLAMLRYVVKLEPLALASHDVVASWLGPTVQRYLTDPAATAAP